MKESCTNTDVKCKSMKTNPHKLNHLNYILQMYYYFLESYPNTQKGSYLQQQTNSPPNQSSAETQSTAVETFSFVDVFNKRKNFFFYYETKRSV